MSGILQLLKSDCNRYSNGKCSTSRCVRRGMDATGAKLPISPGYSIATCEQHEAIIEIEALKDRHGAACLMRDALSAENDRLREKLATVHKLICEASGHLARTCLGDDKDVDIAASTIALAIRLGA